VLIDLRLQPRPSHLMSPEIAGQPTEVGGQNNTLLKVTFSSLLRPSTEEPTEDRRFCPIERACWHQNRILHSEFPDKPLKPNEPLGVARNLSCPTLAFYGDEDEFVPVSDIELLKDRFAKSAQFAEVVVYSGAGHAFMNDTRPDAYRPDDAANAWQRMVAFLTEQLNR